MAEAKTQPTPADVGAFLAAKAGPARLADCETLVALMRKITQCPPVMWGPSIVGFGSYHYRYDSGREGDACLLGFSPRSGDISIYVVSGFDGAEAILAELGRCKTAKACLYVKRLSDIDLPALEKLLRHSVAVIQTRYPAGRGA